MRDRPHHESYGSSPRGLSGRSYVVPTPARQTSATGGRPRQAATPPEDPYYAAPVPWDAISAIGSVLGGLAIVLAFVQLGAQRQDRLRAQISKVGIWVGEWEPAPTRANEQPWTIPVHVRNSSELPVMVLEVSLHVTPRDGHGKKAPLQPLETIAPGRTGKAPASTERNPCARTRSRSRPSSGARPWPMPRDASGKYGPTEAGGPASSGGHGTDGTTARGG